MSRPPVTSTHGPCARCGKVRAIQPRRGNLCSSCRYFTNDRPPGDWVDDAACRGVDPELFWPDSAHDKDAKAAQEVCMTCPVLNDCLVYAIDTNQSQGIWGGLTPSGRVAYAERLEEAV